MKVELIGTEIVSETINRFSGRTEDARLYVDDGIDIWFGLEGVVEVPRHLLGLLKGSGIIFYIKQDKQGSSLLLGASRLAFSGLLTRWLDDPHLEEVGRQMAALLEVPFATRPITTLAGTEIVWGEKTYIMGVLNITPDSFYDGGHFTNLTDALEQASKMIEEGADIIDVGGESTRPGAAPLDADTEKNRVVPVITEITQRWGVPVSIDTYKSEVARAALEAGATFINDVTGLGADANMAKVAADYDVPVCIQHILGTPQNMQEDPKYLSVVPEVIHSIKMRVDCALKSGIKPENIIIDPGFGFGKKLEHNLNLLKRLRHFKSLGYPVLVGTSRKSMIGMVLDQPPSQRLEGTASTVALSVAGLADIIRVHDVGFMVKVAKMADAVYRGYPA